MNTRITGTLSLLVAAALLAAGCSRSSTGPDPADQTGYPERTGPANVIAKLAMAYEEMDAEAYLDCLAEEFIFFLNPDDMNEYPSLPEYWDKNGETAIHENMFGEGTDVQSVALVFTHDTSTWHGGGTPDPLDDLWSYVEDVDLRLVLPSDLTLHVEAPAEFLFRVDPDSTGPGGEILWEIWKQWDIREGSRGGCSDGREQASWGRVKSMYR